MDKKIIGWIFLIMAISFLDFFPGPTDTLTLPLYSAYSGADISPGNLSAIYFDYFIWSTGIGILLLIIGLSILGWDFKRLGRKLNITKYKTAIGLAILSVIAISILDIWSMNSGIFGNVLQYTSGNFQVNGDWWSLFFKFNMLFLLAVPLSYYFFVNKDKSEFLGIYGASIILWFGGLADLFFFIFQKLPIPETLPHLNNSLFIGWISSTLGFEQVTNVSILISIFISIILTLLYTKVMKEKF